MKKETAVAAIIVAAVLAFIGGYLLGGFDGHVSEGERPTVGGHGTYDSNVLPIGESPVKGRPAAPVTVVFFADFSNSSTAAAANMLDEVVSDSRWANDIRLVVKVLPGRDEGSRVAAAAALYAAENGRFFDDVYQGLVRNAASPDRAAIERVLSDAGLDTATFREAFQAGRFDAILEADANLARSLGAARAPVVLVNGRTLAGATLEVGSLREAIFGEQEAASNLTSAGTPPAAVYSARVRHNAEGRQAVARRDRGAAGAEGEGERPAPRERPTEARPTPREEAPAARRERPAAQPPSGDVERLRVPIDGSPALGPDDALVTIAIFSDFHCPFCSRVNPTLETLREEYGSDLRLVFKQNPLPMHPEAPLAHDAALAAHAQGQFWPMHDLIFENQRARAREDYIRHAQSLGLDVQAFTEYLDSNRGEEIIQEDQALATRVNARGTPHFFVNGRRIRGAQPVDAFREVIDSELALARQMLEQGVARSDIYNRLMAGAAERAVAEQERPAEPTNVEPPPVGNSPTLGPDNAPVTVFIFSEFECPFCGRVQPALEQIREEYGDQVRFVFKSFPLPFHSNANLASQAALAAGEQNRFWEYHDILFQNQRALSRSDLERYAEQLNLDMNRFREALDTGRYAEQVDRELAEGRAAGVSGTPTFVINGERVVGALPFDRFQPVIERHLRQ
jgi:protein-disulfide isomerase